MSTRANVKIVDVNGGVIWLYKHHDGYPTHTGDWLHHSFTTRNNSLENVIDGLVKQGFERTHEEHGDINWLYIIRLTEDEIDMEIYEYHHESYGNDVTRVKDSRFSWVGSDAEVWTRYKVYESRLGIEEAQYKLEYWRNREADYRVYKAENKPKSLLKGVKNG